MSSQRPYDLLLFGATGFTGGLTAEYLAGRAGPECRWAVAGRSGDRLRELRARLEESVPGGSLPDLVEARLDDVASLRAMAASARVVATTVGPFAEYGEPVVAACVAEGSHYADITGEPDFVARVVETHGAAAAAAGLRLVSCCGFDSVPHDLGVLLTVRQLPADAALSVDGFVRARGGLSGGTWRSAVEAMAQMPLLRSRRPRRPSQPASQPRRARPARQHVHYDRAFGEWVAPLPTIDPEVVLRSARELAEYGPDFRYGHYLRVGSLPRLVAGAALVGSIFTLSKLPPARRLLLSLRPSGAGPDAEERARSAFSVVFRGRGGGRRAVVEVRGGDPGYGETSKMLAESALCLAFDADRLPRRFGVLTPAAAMGDALLERLRAAGLVFEVLETGEDDQQEKERR